MNWPRGDRWTDLNSPHPFDHGSDHGFERTKMGRWRSNGRSCLQEIALRKALVQREEPRGAPKPPSPASSASSFAAGASGGGGGGGGVGHERGEFDVHVGGEPVVGPQAVKQLLRGRATERVRQHLRDLGERYGS